MQVLRVQHHHKFPTLSGWREKKNCLRVEFTQNILAKDSFHSNFWLENNTRKNWWWVGGTFLDTHDIQTESLASNRVPQFQNISYLLKTFLDCFMVFHLSLKFTAKGHPSCMPTTLLQFCIQFGFFFYTNKKFFDTSWLPNNLPQF